MSRKVYPIYVKKIREEKHYTQEFLAECAGVSVRTLQNIEGGNGCKMDTLKDVAAILEIPVIQLLPSPKEAQAYQPSWWRVFKMWCYRSVFQPLLYGAIACLAAAGFFVFMNYYHEGYVDYVPSPEADAFFEKDKLKMETEHPERFKEGPPEPVSDKEFAQSVVAAYKYLYWFFVFGFYILSFNYYQRYRDYVMLVSDPFARFMTRLLNKVGFNAA